MSDLRPCTARPAVPKTRLESAPQPTDFSGPNDRGFGVPQTDVFGTGACSHRTRNEVLNHHLAAGLAAKTQAGTAYCTATVTVFEVAPPMVSTTDTALPVGALSGTRTLTW